MSLVFTATVPHAPLLLPSIGAAQATELAPTLQAIKELEGELYMMKPEVLFIISPHLEIGVGYFPLNGAPVLTANFSAFGDSKTTFSFPTNNEQVSHLRYLMHKNHLPLNTISIEEMDYGTAVPLALLANHLSGLSVVSMGISNLSLEDHWNMGQAIRTCLQESNKRIAVIGSADLGHKTSPESPYGYSPDSQSFDSLIQTMIREKRLADIKTIHSNIQNESGECGLRVFAMIFGLLDGLEVESKILSYQAPFGVGHLVSEYLVQ